MTIAGFLLGLELHVSCTEKTETPRQVMWLLGTRNSSVPRHFDGFRHVILEELRLDDWWWLEPWNFPG